MRGVNDFATAPNYIIGAIEAVLTAAMTAEQVAQIQKQPIPTYAQGGLVGGYAGVDNNIIRASRGEYVVNAAAVSQNKTAIESLNNDGGAALAKLIGKHVATEIAANPPMLVVPTDSITKSQKRQAKIKNQSRL